MSQVAFGDDLRDGGLERHALEGDGTRHQPEDQHHVPQLHLSAEHQQQKDRQHRHAGAVRTDHQLAAVEPVDDGAGKRRDDDVRQRAEDPGQAEQQQVAGLRVHPERKSEPGQCRTGEREHLPEGDQTELAEAGEGAIGVDAAAEQRVRARLAARPDRLGALAAVVKPPGGVHAALLARHLGLGALSHPQVGRRDDLGQFVSTVVEEVVASILDQHRRNPVGVDHPLIAALLPEPRRLVGLPDDADDGGVETHRSPLVHLGEIVLGVAAVLTHRLDHVRGMAGVHAGQVRSHARQPVREVAVAGEPVAGGQPRQGRHDPARGTRGREGTTEVDRRDLTAPPRQLLGHRRGDGTSGDAVPVQHQGPLDALHNLVGDLRRQLRHRQHFLVCEHRVMPGRLDGVERHRCWEGLGQVGVDAGVGPAVGHRDDGHRPGRRVGGRRELVQDAVPTPGGEPLHHQRREPLDRRMRDDVHDPDRCPLAEERLHAGSNLRGHQRVATQVEEVGDDAGGIDLQQLGEDIRDDLLRGVPRRDVPGGRGAIGLCQGPAVDLAMPLHGELANGRVDARHHVLGQLPA